jgi:hypothetical protein
LPPNRPRALFFSFPFFPFRCGVQNTSAPSGAREAHGQRDAHTLFPLEFFTHTLLSFRSVSTLLLLRVAQRASFILSSAFLRVASRCFCVSAPLPPSLPSLLSSSFVRCVCTPDPFAVHYSFGAFAVHHRHFKSQKVF